MSQSKIAPSLHAGFEHPNPEFSPVPIWWWSGEALDVERMRWQIDQLVSQGVHNAVVLNLAPTGPAHGALSDSPHMSSPQWWEIWDQLCAYSQQVGMRLWFYDQIGFSGANLQGRIVVEHPDFVGMALHREIADVDGDGEIGVPEIGIAIAAQALPLGSNGAVAGAPIDLPLVDGQARWKGPGRARLMVAYALRKGFDYHSPEACAKLIDTVHGEFERRLQRYFGTSLVGSFQDELPSVPSWSARFAAEFEKRCGYPIAPKIAALWEDWGLDSARVRIDYQRVRAALAEEALFKPLFDWHERHGLTFGVDQQSPARAAEPLGATDQYADYARTHRWYSAPGSDHWGDAKFHSSIAHSYGRPRTWIESFHSSGWGGTLEETFDWLQPWLLAGANLYDPHAVYYSTRGGQWEWAAPSTCWRQPYWRHYKTFADTISRLCWLATRGEHVCEIGVLFPSAAVQADLFLGSAGKKGRAAHGAYMALLGSMIWFNTRKGILSKMKRDFDVLDDDTVAGAKVEDGVLQTRGERYRAIIVPQAWLLETATLRRLLDFAQAGGQLIFVGALPEATDEPAGDALLVRLRRLIDERAARLIAGGDELSEALEQALAPVPARIVAESPALLRQVDGVNVAFVTAAPEGSATRQPMLPWAIWDYDTDVFSFVRYNNELRETGYDFDPARNRRQSVVRISGSVGAVEQWDPATGTSRPVPASRRGDVTEVVADFSDSPMVALVWSRDGVSEKAEATAPAATPLPLDGPWRSSIVPTIDNRFGDFTLPAAPGPLPVQAWIVEHQESASASPVGLDEDAWEKVPVSDGIRAWQYGPAAPEALPPILTAGHAGPIDEAGWSPVRYSLSRGIDHDFLHDRSLGPKARIPEMFWRIRDVKANQAVQLRTALPMGEKKVLTLAIGANGSKQIWWNGEQLAPDPGGFLHMVEVHAEAGLNLLELRVTAVSDDDLAGYWALTTDREAFERPEWLVPADGGKAGTTLTIRRALTLEGGEEVVAHFGSEGVATLLVNGARIAMHGAFEPYAGWPTPRTMKYPLTEHLRAGDNRIEVRFTDAGTPLAMYFDCEIARPGGNRPRSLVSDAGWSAEREGQPVALSLRAPSRRDPRWTVLKPRPHPLPRTGWLDPEQPLAGVLDIVPEPYPGKPKQPQWFRISVPPGAHRVRLPVAKSELAAFYDGTELVVRDGAIDLPDADREERTLLVRAKAADGRLGGALWDGPAEFEIGRGRISLGSWTEKGLAFYSGGVAYERTISLDDPVRYAVLDLGSVRGTAEVEVNGRAAGVRVWSPYRFKLDGLLVRGDNTIAIRVFNTLAPYLSGASPTRSIFRGQTISGLFGPVTLR